MDFAFLTLSVVVLLTALRTQMGICLSENFISWDDLEVQKNFGQLSFNNKVQGRVIVVAKDGSGHSRTVQGGVNLVPDGNRERVKIFIQPGIYREKVIVPITKPYVSFIGNRTSETVISWNSTASDRGSDGQVVGTFASASVAIESDYFCARGITFENTAPSALPGAQGMQAVALRVSCDKAMFFRCRILGSQDTLFDHYGRHYFYKSYIEGSIDFIFGKGRSLYQGCTLHAISDSYGAIAASQRDSSSEDTGFSFLKCHLNGSGIFYLGRAWGRYSRVVYSYCHLEGIIIPEGWNDWGDPSRRGTVLFGEFMCKGRGASSKERVPWAKTLSYEEAKPFLNRSFIDGDQWLRL
ncbi:pectin lyase-like superfamily protein [Tasmannia lanceolata]|uniref:pectin lyase-like superfamily protein n=1 Tax=Tasmannia lanceolata TaxID=3420 RepID=UPI0040645F83